MNAKTMARSIYRTSHAVAAVVTVGLGAACAEAPRSFEGAAEELRRAVVEVDRNALEALADEFADFAEDGTRPAEARYGEGLALQASVWTPSFGNPGLDAEKIRRRLERADGALTLSLEGRPELVEARALQLFNRITRAMFEEDDARRSLQDSTAKQAQRLAKHHPEHPGALTMRAFALLQTRPGDFAEEGLPYLERAGEIVTERQPRDVLGTQVWSMLPLVLSVRINMFVLRDFRAAKRAADTGAHLDPPVPPLQAMSEQLQRSVGHRPVERSSLPTGEWRLLAADPAGDVSDGAIADGKTLSYQLGDQNRTVWLKFETHNEFPVDGFGVNLVINDDGDQQSGQTWWGGGTDLTFDRLVTVWVTRHESGTYDGQVGVTEADEAMELNMVSILNGDLPFTILEDENAVVVGVPSSALPERSEIYVVGAVGSPTNWNDNLPDHGPVTLTLER